MLRIEALKYIQENYKKVSIEEISKATQISIKGLKDGYPQYFYTYETIIHWKPLNKYVAKTKEGYIILNAKPLNIPRNYKITTTPKFTRWQNPLAYTSKMLAKEDLEMIRSSFSERSKYIGKTWKVKSPAGDKLYPNMTRLELSKTLQIPFNKVSYWITLGLIEQVK